MSKKVKVAIVGAGTAGLNAMGQLRRVTDDFHRRKLFPREDIDGDEGLSVDIPESFEHVRDIRDILVDRVLDHSTDEMGDELIDGYARFTGPGVLEVNGETIEAENIVLAAGTKPVVPEPWQAFGDRILTTDNLFEQEEWPASLAVIGLGVIGLELGQALSHMGIDVTGFDLAGVVGGINDPAINQLMLDIVDKEFPMHLGESVELEECEGGFKVSAGEHSVVVEKVLVCMGRRSNLSAMNIEQAGVALMENGLPD